MANPITWFEIIGPDASALHRFYREVFSWKLTPPVMEMGNYSMLEDHEPGIGGGNTVGLLKANARPARRPAPKRASRPRAKKKKPAKRTRTSAKKGTRKTTR